MRTRLAGFGRSLKIVLVALALLANGTGIHAASAQDDGGGGSQPPEIEPAPEGFADELIDLYGLAFDAAQKVTSAAGQAEQLDGTSSPGGFADAVADLSDEELGMLYEITQDVEEWSSLPQAYRDLAEAADGIPEQPREGEERLTSGQRTTGFEVPPPEPPEPDAVIEPFPAADCGVQPGGPFYGREAILGATIANTVAGTIADSFPKIFFIWKLKDLPNPIAWILNAIVLVTTTIQNTFEFVHDRYFFCLGEYFYGTHYNVDAISIDVWNLLNVANGTINNLNDGVIVLRDQLIVTQEATDELLTSEIQQALVAPVGTVPNVAYVLPATNDGYLDSTPIGVRSIVTQALAAARKVGLPVSAASETYLAEAEDALAADEYAQAYEMYQRAYQQVVGE